MNTQSGHQHRALHLMRGSNRVHPGRRFRVPPPEVEGELVPVEGDDRDQDEQEQRHELGDRRDDVDEGRLLDALQDQRVDEPQTKARRR